MRHIAVSIATRLPGVLRTLSICLPFALSHAPASLAESVGPTLTAAIPAQPLERALEAFTRQTGLHLAYVSGVVRNQKSHLVSAGLSAEEALSRMLQGTGLSFEFLTPHSVRILVKATEPTVQSPAASDESQPPEVLVTGSRIPVPADRNATGPIQIITARDIVLNGYVDTVGVLSAVPQTIVSSTNDYGNYSNPFGPTGGIATADLRGLGPQRTVVLVNGRRLGLGDPTTANLTPAPDLDQVPLAMVERIEILTGGGSMMYGSDAIAGVVNFILKDHVQGVQVDGQYGFAQHTQHNKEVQVAEAAAGFTAPMGNVLDGFGREVSIIAGSGFHNGDGQATGYFIYHHQDPVYGSARDFSACPAVSTNLYTGMVTERGVTCAGSANSNLFITNAGQGAAYSVVGSRFVPWPAAGSVPPALFNFVPYWSSQRKDDRYQTGLLAHLEITPAAKSYVEFNFMEDQTLTYVSPSGLFLGGNNSADGGFLVNCSNPLLSSQEAAILCTPAQILADKANPGSVNADLQIGRRNIEGGARTSYYEHRNYRVVGGVEGKVGRAWSYDAYALYYYTSVFNSNQNLLNVINIQNALQVTTGPSGRPLCISGGTCVPYNIFRTGAVTTQQLAYLDENGSGTSAGANSEQIVQADITGQLSHYGLVAPSARDGLAFNAGVEHRTETLRSAPDAVELSGNLVGFGIAPFAIDKRISANDVFLEVRLPIVQDHLFAKDLALDAGYRYSAYSTAGATNTYKFDLLFAPISDLLVRSAYNRAVRAPNLIELYTPLSYSGSADVSSDPCAPSNGGATHAAASLAQCIRTGVTATQYGNGLGPAVGGTNSISQCGYNGCGVVAGGNTALAPETSETWSLGTRFTPMATFVSSLDYFHILLKDAIGTVPDSVTLQQCLASGDPAWCSQIVRTPTGTLRILTTLVNTGSAVVSGIDLQLHYRRPLGSWGALTASLTGTWLQHSSVTPYRSAPSYDCAGLFGDTCLGGSVEPTWRHNARLTYETPWNLQLSAQWRFIGRTGFDNNSRQPVLQGQEEGFFDPVLTHIPGYSYFDLSAAWALSQHLEVRAGISNAFDKDPPFLPSDVAGNAGWLNTFPTYDILGRNIFAAFRATF